MKSKLLLVAIVCVVATAAAQVPWGGESPRPRAQVYALEGLGALGGTAACCGCSYAAGRLLIPLMVGSGSDPEWRYWNGLAAAVVYSALSASVLPAAVGYGAAKVGDELGENGSTGWAVVGAYAGLPLAVGAIALGLDVATGRYGERTSHWDIPFYVVGGLCIPAGAVVGYNLGIPREAGPHRSGLEGRLQAPGVALTSVELPDHSVEYGMKVQLAGLRF